ncbi:adenosylmethionine--8-amino-7-oxononanoate transaminase [Candidatus Rariloculus sp.]|uniref:adenosylmethionine--8-amino-7-oxononanoate transaminase n=1 Tax=Candidatus Rariloculus sp. TaxID=3101265 RepID=UPI003D11FFF5
MKSAPPPQEARRTDGVWITLADGRRLIDGTASWWTACHGYNHPHIRTAVEAQLGAMPHIMLGGLVHASVLVLARRLAGVLPGDLDHVFFSESGSVSVEIAMKMALQFWINQGESARRRFVSFSNAYHGDTFAAMSVCDPEEGMHAMFRGVLPEQLVLDLPDSPNGARALELALARHAPELAALIVEPLVQAAGGMKFHSPDVLASVVELARRHGLLVIFDEIATGFGRTGTMFACEQAGIVPDIITLSKALTGGTLPLAATVARRHVFERFLSDDPDKELMHGPTFAGNPLGCAAANASLDLFAREPRLEQVAAIEARLADGLADLRGCRGVSDVRVKGAIGVVELDRQPDLDQLRMRFVEEGVWVRPFRNVVYLMPAFVIAEAELDELIRAVGTVVSEVG